MTDRERGKLYKALRKWEKDIMANMRFLAKEANRDETRKELYTEMHEQSAEVLLKVMEIEDLLMQDNYMAQKYLTEGGK